VATAPNPPAPTSSAPETAPLSEGARIVGTFIAPSKTFTDLRRNSSWWAPWILTAVVSLIFVYAMQRQIGFEQIAKNSIAQSSRAEQFDKLSPDQQAKQMAFAVILTRYISWATPVMILLVYAVIAAVLFGTFKFAGGADITFGRSFAIVTYGSLPGILGGILGTISLFAGVDPEGFNPKNAVATNPAYFMDPTQSKFLYGMASALDVIVIWSIVLMGIGFACNSKVKRSTAIMIIAGWYLLYKLVGAGFAAIAS
jgi:Yip1-like protein